LHDIERVVQMKRLLKAIAVLLVLVLLMAAAPAAVADDDTNIPSLKEVYKDYFKIGCAGAHRGTNNIFGTGTAGQFAQYHFNVFTSENDMKIDATRPRRDTFVLNGYDILNQIKSNNLDFEVIGHVLVWHNQMPSWMVNALNNPSSNPGDTPLDIMEEHIKGVLEGYREVIGTDENGNPILGESLIKTWDVVNEAFQDIVYPMPAPNDWRDYLRPSPWLNSIGPDYIEYAFRLARKYAPDATLIYNDFNCEMPGKREAICMMVEEINNKWFAEGNTRPLIEVIGLQSHEGNWRTLPENYEILLDMISRLEGVRVHVTEMDFYWNQDQSSTQPLSLHWQREQAIQWAEIFSIYKKYSNIIDRVTFWGLHDGLNWRGSKHAMPFNRDFTPKEAFWAIVDPEGYLEKYARPRLTVSSSKSHVAKGETFTVNAGFTRNAMSKEAKLNVYFDASKVEFISFTPADDINLSGEPVTVTQGLIDNITDSAERANVNPPYGYPAGYSGLSFTLTCDNDYDMPGLGALTFKAREDVDLDDAKSGIYLQVSYLKKYPDLDTVFRISHPLMVNVGFEVIPVIEVQDVINGNRQANVDFHIRSANGKGYTVYLSETGADGTFMEYSNVNYNGKGVHIRGLENGRTYYAYIEYSDGNGIERSLPVILSPGK